jgi:D-glycero-D-manno-heptose 1,7-bisphosphate phosphatase
VTSQQHRLAAGLSSAARWPLNADGAWLRAQPVPTAPRPGLFLDRDGVVIEDLGYVSRRDQVRLMPGAASLIRRANEASVAVAVVTNQSGIARGLYGWDEFAAVEEAITELLTTAGATVDGVCACPFHPDFGGDAVRTARWRKPGPAMIEALAMALRIDRRRSWLIGDKASDIAAARNARLAGAVLVLCGHGEADLDTAKALVTSDFRVSIASDIDAASAMLAGELFEARS